MIEKEIKNYDGRCRINLTKKDNINSTKVYLFTPEEHSEIKSLMREVEKIESNKKLIQELKSEVKKLKETNSNNDDLLNEINSLTQENTNLNEKLKEKSKELEDLRRECDDLMETNKNLSQNINLKESEFSPINKELHQVKNKLIVTIENKDSEIDYLKEIISDYEKRGIGKRIRNKNPKSYILEPNYKLIESNVKEEE